MGQECGFFDAYLVGEEYDRVYLAAQFALYFASFIGNGVFGHSMQKLEVMAQDTANMSTKVLPGEAWINGYWYRNTDVYTLHHSVADGVLSRIDTIVLRWSNSDRAIYLHVIEGTPSYNPIAPPIVRDSDYYDLGLARVSIPAGAIRITQTQIQDLRLNNDFCGLVTGVVDQIDTTDLYNQFESYFKDFKEKYEADYDTWTKEQKQAYIDYITGSQADYDTWISDQRNNYIQFVNKSESDYNSYIADEKSKYDAFLAQTASDYDTWTKEQKEAYRQWYVTHTSVWEQEFTEWFERLKEILSGDVAGNLQLEIEELQGRVKILEEFMYNVTEKQEIYPMIYDTLYDQIIGKLTTASGEVITDELNNEIDIIGDAHEPILDSDGEAVRSTIKLCIL